MRRVVILSIAVLPLLSLTVLATTVAGTAPVAPPPPQVLSQTGIQKAPDLSSVLDKTVLVSWYGNPWSERMGILGRLDGDALAEGLKKQAAAYAAVTNKHVTPAYELVTLVGQPAPGRDGTYRRRESYQVIDRMFVRSALVPSSFGLLARSSRRSQGHGPRDRTLPRFRKLQHE